MKCNRCKHHGIRVVNENTTEGFCKIKNKHMTYEERRGCTEYEKRMTNADKIRAMSDEELAVLLVRTELEEIPSEFYDDETQVVFRSPSGKKFYWKEQAIKDSLEWLKQEGADGR